MNRAVLLLFLLLAAGCGDSRRESAAPRPVQVEASAQWSEELFGHAIDNLNRLEEFDAGEVRRLIVERMQSVGASRRAPQADQADSLRTTWPEPEMLEQVVGRLGQWAKAQDPPPGWKRDPLLATLPGGVAELPMVRDLDQVQFSSYDGFGLLEAVLLRDIASWARGRGGSELDRAQRLFDWTIRNIQFEAESPDRIPLVPWESLLLGRGTAMERAGIFILLLRQEGIDAAMLELPIAAKSLMTLEKGPGLEGVASEGDHWLVPWCVAALVEGKLYLFDPRLGLPIPSPGGVRVEGGRLEVLPATLEQVVREPSILDRVDFDSKHPYWAKSLDLKQAVVAVEASPLYLAKRAKLVESRLVGKQKMVLCCDATGQATRFQAAAHDAKVHLWSLPYQTLLRRSQLGTGGVCRQLNAIWPFFAGNGTPLFRGRIFHLKGRFADSEGAIAHYQAARPTDEALMGEQRRLFAEYMKAAPAEFEQLPPDRQAEAKQQMAQEAAMKVHLQMALFRRGKADATYWLGLVSFEQGNYPSAVDYFAQRTLEASPRGPWTLGARYNLGRALEAMGSAERAFDEYRKEGSVPAYYGNRLRAHWLADFLAAGAKRAGEGKK